MIDGSSSNFIVAVASTITASAIVYGVSSLRRAIKRIAEEHDWLMKTTKEHSKAILKLTKIIERRSRDAD